MHVKRKKVSDYDPRTPAQIASGGCVGGDRMLDHGYAQFYSKYLSSYIQKRHDVFTICEIGILNGTGLAIWCDLFPKSRIIGFDIELKYIQMNLENLSKLGAFAANSPELHEYDQFVYSEDYLQEILNGDKIDICIDDGNHSNEANLTTLKSVLPHLNDEFVYFVEDNQNVYEEICNLLKGFSIHQHGQLTVVRA